jgi:hypothetical protein
VPHSRCRQPKALGAVDDVELDRVAGSSTTPDGFNDALRQIRTEAAE